MGVLLRRRARAASKGGEDADAGVVVVSGQSEEGGRETGAGEYHVVFREEVVTLRAFGFVYE